MNITLTKHQWQNKKAELTNLFEVIKGSQNNVVPSSDQANSSQQLKDKSFSSAIWKTMRAKILHFSKETGV